MHRTRTIAFMSLSAALALLPATPAQTPPGLTAPPGPEQLVAEMRAAALAVPYFMRGELAYGRVTGRPFSEFERRMRAALAATYALSQLPDRLPTLAADPEPAVRLLAAFALYRTCDPQHLPLLGNLCSDAGEVPSRIRLIGAGGPEDEARFHREHPEMASTTVGAEVQGWLTVWQAPPADSDAFAPWCERQLRHAPTVHGLRVSLTLATNGYTSNFESFVPQLLVVLDRVGQAHDGARELAMIAMFHDKVPALTSNRRGIGDELLFAARRLGHDNLLRVLRGDAPLIAGAALPEDNVGDLLPTVAAFVLEHPVEVGLEPDDVPALLALGDASGRHGYRRAAARLQPERATALLSPALTSTPHAFLDADQLSCATLLWDLAGPQNADALLEWALAPATGPVLGTPSRQRALAEHLLTRFGAADRRMFRRIVEDERFATTAPFELAALLRCLDRTRFEPLVGEDPMQRLTHPWSIRRAWLDLERATVAHPRETAAMLATAAEWRRAIVEHTRNW